MQLEKFSSDGKLVNVWDLIDGRPRCEQPPVALYSADAMPALQRQRAVQAMIDDVEAYEAAQAVIARGVEPGGRPDQAQALADAEALVAAATETTLALARWRAAEAGAVESETVEGDAAEAEGADWEADRATVLAALATEAAKPLAIDPRPVAPKISRRQFALASLQLGLMTLAEAEAFLSTNAIPPMLSDAIAKMPPQLQPGVRLTVMGSVEFNSDDPATVSLMGLVDLPPGYADAAALRDAIWRLGATFV